MTRNLYVLAGEVLLSMNCRCGQKIGPFIRHGTLLIIAKIRELNSMYWRDSCPSNPCYTLLFWCILKVNHAFEIKPIIMKYSEFTTGNNLDALSDDDVHFSIHSILKICTQSPARLEHG